MKILFVGDLHFGVRNDSDFFIQIQKEYFRDFFFPYVKKNKIKHIIFLGDVFDKRRYVNYKTLKHIRKNFVSGLLEMDVTCHFIVGNHDTFFKNTLSLNAYGEIFPRPMPVNFFVYYEPKEIKIGKTSLLMCPWINNENEKEINEAIEYSSSDLCIGHFEINGIIMTKGISCSSGITPKLFQNFDRVFSGHLHGPSEKDNITYVGSPIQYNWNDYGDPKRLIEFDTTSKEYKNVEFSKSQLFEKLSYDDSYEGYTPVPPNNLKNKFLKLFVVKKYSPLVFEKYCNTIRNQNPENFEIIESSSYSDDSVAPDDMMERGTEDLINETIDEITEISPIQRDGLKRLMSELHLEAEALRKI